MGAETQQQDDNDFSAAFAQFGAEDNGAAQAKPVPVAEAVAPEGTETPAAPEGTETPAAPEGTETPAAPEGTETPAAPEGTEQVTEPTTQETEKHDTQDILARLAALVNTTPPPKQDTDQETAAEPAATSEPEPELYTDEEKKLLTEYESDWPDVAKAEALCRRGEYRGLVNHVFNEIAKELGPITQTLKILAERTHLNDLREKVEDYDDVRDNVIGWVNNQPAYLQNAYKHVIQQGTPDEIADLVARYKKETAPSTPTVVPLKQETELPATTKQAVAALAPVSSKRSTVVQADDPNDFEGAFAAFAKQL